MVEFVPVPVEEEFVPVPVEEESEQSVLGSVARGTGAGLVNIPQGIAELGVMGLETAGIVDEGSQ